MFRSVKLYTNKTPNCRHELSAFSSWKTKKMKEKKKKKKKKHKKTNKHQNVIYHNNQKNWDRQALANSADPDQMPQSIGTARSEQTVKQKKK